MKNRMTVTKAKEILKELDATIEKLEDEAIALWSMIDESGLHEMKCEGMSFRLTQRYTTRRAIRNWLTRNTR